MKRPRIERPFHRVFATLTILSILVGCGEESMPTGTSDDEAAPIFVTYGFSSGSPRDRGANDGFQWPPSPPGMIDDHPSSTFTTPEGVIFFHDIGNSLFFDDDHLMPDEASAGTGIVGGAMWGQPRPVFADQRIETVIVIFPVPIDSIGFDFAWAVGNEEAPGELHLGLGEGTGGDEIVTVSLPELFDAGEVFGHSGGHSGRIGFTVADLAALGIEFSGIQHLSIFVDAVSHPGPNATFAIDNLTAFSRRD